jgi:hypothetical protein
MPSHLSGQDLWWFRSVHDTLLDFAEDPDLVLGRSGPINVPEDLSNTFGEHLRLIRSKYTEASAPELLKVASAVNNILSAKSLGGLAFEEKFWTNAAFRAHPDWQQIRQLCRSLLLK